jgi:prepilin-type N-terminal cleavage/methylation domain-containing protein
MQKGFTIIELMIVVAIIGIIVSVAVPAVTGKKSQYLLAPATQCIGGYTFTNRNTPVQIIDNNGKGIPCEGNFQR